MRPIEPPVQARAGAVAPLHCGVDVVGHGETVRPHVFDDDRGDLVRRAWPRVALEDRRALRSAICETRLARGEIGCCRDAWQPRS
ncbi:MAG: hypothetical protein J0L88_05180 [Xanthomonadales bacterium]|nr:hypothetical protein [Xanthomonadales bacterium]